jgi:peptide/nickel transport system permease protein
MTAPVHTDAAPRWWQSDFLHDLRRSPLAMISGGVALVLILAGLGADLIAPFDAFDPSAANVVDARLPPGSQGMFGGSFLLGTDPQGRDMLSAMIYGLRTSLIVGFGAVLIAMIAGTTLGLISGYFGGVIDSVIMRIADVQLSFPAILIALLIDGITRAVMDRASHDAMAVPVLILAIAASYWVQYARTVRSMVIVERGREYVLAARITGVSTLNILLQHILPNVLGPVTVIATINLALAIVVESTLSFLGVGIPATQPSLGTLVRIGNEFLFSGDWWITLFPAGLLVVLSLAVNLFGDWLRDALNPRLSA